MRAKVVQDADVVTYVVVCDPGDEAVTALAQFARAERLEAAQVTAIGAFERATVGWFDRAARPRRGQSGTTHNSSVAAADLARGQHAQDSAAQRPSDHCGSSPTGHDT